jgi:hypothetical protein
MKLAFHDNVRFCPHCGCENLERDFFRQAPPQENGGGPKGVKQISGGTEWTCKLCGFGFKIGKSSRYTLAETLIRRESSLRGAVKFDEQCVGKEIARLYDQDKHLLTKA